DRLLGVGRPFARFKEFQAELAASRQLPAEVTRGRRVAHLAVLALFLFIGIETMLLTGLCLHLPVLMALDMRIQVNEEALRVVRVDAARNTIQTVPRQQGGVPAATTVSVTIPSAERFRTMVSRLEQRQQRRRDQVERDRREYAARLEAQGVLARPLEPMLKQS